MAKAEQGTVRVRWVRSGIAFNRKQEEAVRALGLRRLQHVVELPDTPLVRGLIAKVPHLIEVIGPVRAAAWASMPEYTITAPPQPVGKEAPLPEAEPEPVAAAPELAEGAPAEPVEAAAAESAPEPKPRRRARTSKAKASAEETGAAQGKD